VKGPGSDATLLRRRRISFRFASEHGERCASGSDRSGAGKTFDPPCVKPHRQMSMHLPLRRPASSGAVPGTKPTPRTGPRGLVVVSTNGQPATRNAYRCARGASLLDQRAANVQAVRRRTGRPVRIGRRHPGRHDRPHPMASPTRPPETTKPKLARRATTSRPPRQGSTLRARSSCSPRSGRPGAHAASPRGWRGRSRRPGWGRGVLRAATGAG